ncbi:MAG: sugar phosphate isomerase/epimerase family protein [Candidatus Brocadiia bacterium]
MDEPVASYAKVGAVHPMLWPATMKGGGPIRKTIERLAADTDFDAVEVTTIADPETRRQVRDTLHAARMTVAFAAQPILLGRTLDLNAPDDAARAEAVEAVKEGIDQAYSLDAVACAVLSGPDPGPADREQATDLLVDSLKWLCDYSAQKGPMPIVLETFDRLHFGKNCLIGPSAEAAEVARRVRQDFPSFGLMLDLSHLPLLGESAEQAIDATREFLVHAHIGNCVMHDSEHEAFGDNHPRFGVPGGENDVPQLTAFLRKLLHSGYLDPVRRPIVSFEVKPLLGESVEALIAGSKRTLAEAWAAV